MSTPTGKGGRPNSKPCSNEALERLREFAEREVRNIADIIGNY